MCECCNPQCDHPDESGELLDCAAPMTDERIDRFGLVQGIVAVVGVLVFGGLYMLLQRGIQF